MHCFFSAISVKSIPSASHVPYNGEVEFPDKLAKSLVKFNQQLAQDVNIHYMSSEREGVEWVTRKPCGAGVVWRVRVAVVWCGVRVRQQPRHAHQVIVLTYDTYDWQLQWVLGLKSGSCLIFQNGEP